MERYFDTKIIDRKYYGTTLYPFITPSEDDIYIITVKGDRLDIIANQYYGDSKLWWIIASSNNISADSLFPPSGTQLRIPQNISEFLNSYKNINNR